MNCLRFYLFIMSLSFSLSIYAEAVSLTPNINNGPKWREFPQVDLGSFNMEGNDREVITIVEANQEGIITLVKIKKSSGRQDVDQKVIEAVKKASFYPYQENGIYYPIRVEQPFVYNISNTNASPDFAEAQKYKTGYQQVILSAWNVPIGSEGMNARVKVDLDNSGQVAQIDFLTEVKPKFKLSIEKAINSVSPFNLPTDPNVKRIAKRLTINFKAK